MKNYLFRNLLFLGMFVLSISAFAQNISGTISDSQGPLAGANVLVKDTSNGTTADFDGNYMLDNVASDAILVVSYLGYTTQEVSIAGQSIINVTLEEDTSVLSEVVVTGYSKQNTRNITGSVAVIKAEELQAVTPVSFEQALQGQAAGVTVGSEGGPGGNAAVRIRGFGTINGNDPLYVVDGVQRGQGLNDLNPNDIESVQVLKDAAAASIYGIGAANGVIIVTTKSGKKNKKTTFSYNSLVGVDFIPNSVFPDMATPQQLADAYWKASLNDGVTPNHAQYGNGASPVLPDYIIPSGVLGAVDESAYSYPDNRITKANKAGTNWFDEFFDSALVQQHNIGVDGGSETSKFYVGLGMLNQEGVGVHTSFDRYNLRANSEFDLSKNIRIGETMNVSYSERIGVTDPINSNSNQNNESQIASLYRMHPIIPVYDVGGNFAGTAGAPGTGAGYNPVAVADRNKENVNKGVNAVGTVYVELDLSEDLMFKTAFTADLYNSNFSYFQPIDYENATARSVNQLREISTSRANINWFNVLQYTKTFNELHSIDVYVGTEFKKNNYKQYYANITGFLFTTPDATYVSAGTGVQTVGGEQDKSSTFSVFGKLDYAYNDKYLIGATLRRDQSSKFPNDKTSVFPALSAGWRISSEEFLDVDWINNLMLKYSWGKVGNNNVPSSRGIRSFGSDLAYNDYAGNTGYTLTNIGNPDLTWETTTMSNIGISATLLDNRVSFGLDIFNNVTEDMLLAVPLDPTIFGNAVSSQYYNVGKMTNKGFDLQLGYSNNSSKEFNYSVNANISAYKNKVNYLTQGDSELVIPNPDLGAQTGFETTNTLAGYPVSSFVGYVWEGVDADGNAIFSGDARTVIGNPHPDFTYGLNFNADYKNFDFSLFFQGSQGNDIYNLTKFWTDFSNFEGGKSLDYVNETNHALTLSADDSKGSSYYIEDGSYIRLKNIAIGYSLGDKITSKIGADKIRVFVQGKNLLTFTDYSGLDPEINLTNYTDPEKANLEIGVDRGAYPVSRSFNVGLNITF